MFTLKRVINVTTRPYIYSNRFISHTAALKSRRGLVFCPCPVYNTHAVYYII